MNFEGIFEELELITSHWQGLYFPQCRAFRFDAGINADTSGLRTLNPSISRFKHTEYLTHYGRPFVFRCSRVYLSTRESAVKRYSYAPYMYEVDASVREFIGVEIFCQIPDIKRAIRWHVSRLYWSQVHSTYVGMGKFVGNFDRPFTCALDWIFNKGATWTCAKIPNYGSRQILDRGYDVLMV